MRKRIAQNGEQINAQIIRYKERMDDYELQLKYTYNNKEYERTAIVKDSIIWRLYPELRTNQNLKDINEITLKDVTEALNDVTTRNVENMTKITSKEPDHEKPIYIPIGVSKKNPKLIAINYKKMEENATN